MKIAQVCPFFYPVEGGVENHVLSISTELLKRGHEVHVLTSANSRDSKALAPSERVSNLEVRRFRPLMILGEFGSFWPGVIMELLDGHYDVVHAHSFRHPHTDLAALSSKITGSSCILTSHSPFHPGEVRGPLARDLVSAYDHMMAPLTLRAFDGVISLTTHEARTLVGLGAPKDRVTVIPNGVGDEHFEETVTDAFISHFGLLGKRVVLYLGRINRTKGIEVLVHSFSLVATKVADAQLVIAGPATDINETTYREDLETLVADLGISGRVTFTGRLSEDDKLAALQACDLLVLPSVYEPFGIVLLEAAAHGKAVVAARTDGPSSIISHGLNGLLVEPRDVSGLAEAILTLLNDDDYRERLGKMARQDAERYRWKNITDRVESLYNRFAPP
ncbi:MAG: glycosyltransferase family 4 protein [Nitrososphaerales archaeon]